MRHLLKPFIGVLVFLASLTSLEATYILRYHTTANGGISYTGNALGLSKQAGQNQPGTADSIGAFITTDSSSQVGTFPTSVNPPAGTTLVWQNNSSSAVLDLPSGSTVLYAELIWMGGYGWGGQIPYPGSPFIPFNTAVTITTPQLVQASVSPAPATSQVAVTPTFTDMGNYVVSQDVTSIIQGGGSGTYVVGGIPASIPASDDTHNAAGWVLAVVYENPNMFTSDLSIFVGCQQASNSAPPAEVSGFCAPPSGTKTARLFVSSIEGDANKTGDRMLFGDTPTLSYPANALSGTNNLINNFFASQINTLLPVTLDVLTGKLMATGSSVLDTRGSYGSRNQNPQTATNISAGRQGIDITSIDVSSLISYNQTTAYAQGTTAGDDYTISSLGLQIQVGSPVLSSLKLVNGVDNVVVSVGDTVTFTDTIANTSSIDAEACLFTDILETGLAFIPGTFKLNGVTQPDPNLVTGFPFGTLAEGATAVIEFQAIVNAYPLNQAFYDNMYNVDYSFVPCLGTDINLVSGSNIVTINFLPRANPDTGTTLENTPLNGGSVLSNDSGTNLRVVAFTQGSEGGTVVVNPDGTYVYTPPLNFTGTDVFTYTAQDQFGNQVTTTVTITVTPSTTPPVANPDSNYTLINTPINGPSVLSNDVGNGLTVISYSQGAQGGTVTVNPNGTYLYIPPLNFVGVDTFTYTAKDIGDQTTSTTVTIVVFPIVTPGANPDFGITPENTPLNGPSVLNNDVGIQLVVISNTQGTQGGSVVVYPGGNYLYIPPLDFIGVDTFTYTARDIFGNEITSTVTITVTPIAPPTYFDGVVSKCKLLNKKQYILVATWGASPTSSVVGYNIYFNGKLVTNVSPSGPLLFQTCLSSKKEGALYSITALGPEGIETAPLKIRITHE